MTAIKNPYPVPKGKEGSEYYCICLKNGLIDKINNPGGDLKKAEEYAKSCRPTTFYFRPKKS